MTETNDLILYHGSTDKFENFKIMPYHKTGSALGFGIYLTDNRTRAISYANNGYLYTVRIKGALLKNQKLISSDKKTLTNKEVSQLIQEIALQQIETDGYPYMISDWDEPTSETEIDTGNKAICDRIAKSVRQGNTTDIEIINDLGNQVGGNDSAASTLNPVLAKFNIHMATQAVSGPLEKGSDYIVFNPSDLNIIQSEDIQPDHEVDDQWSH